MATGPFAANGTNALLTEALQPSEQMGEMERNLYIVRGDVWRLIAEPGTPDRKKLVDGIASMRARNEVLLNGPEARPMQPEEARLLAEFKKEWDLALDLRAEAVTTAVSDREAGAAIMDTNVRPHDHASRSAIRSLVDLKTKSANEHVEATRATVSLGPPSLTAAPSGRSSQSGTLAGGRSEWTSRATYSASASPITHLMVALPPAGGQSNAKSLQT